MLTGEGQKDEMQQRFWQTGAHQETCPGPESMELLQLFTCCTTTTHTCIMSAYHMHPCNTGHTNFGSWNSPQFVKLQNASSTCIHTHPQLPPQSSGYGNLVYLCLQILHGFTKSQSLLFRHVPTYQALKVGQGIKVMQSLASIVPTVTNVYRDTKSYHSFQLVLLGIIISSTLTHNRS